MVRVRLRPASVRPSAAAPGVIRRGRRGSRVAFLGEACLSNIESHLEKNLLRVGARFPRLYRACEYAYTAMVEDMVTRVTATASDENAGVAFFDGDGSELDDLDTNTHGHQVKLDVGDNLIEVRVTAEDGAPQSCRVTQMRCGNAPRRRTGDDNAPQIHAVWDESTERGNPSDGRALARMPPGDRRPESPRIDSPAERTDRKPARWLAIRKSSSPMKAATACTPGGTTPRPSLSANIVETAATLGISGGRLR